MEKDLKNNLESFLNDEDKLKQQKEENTSVIIERTGLVERIEKTKVLSDGRQLLTERYF